MAGGANAPAAVTVIAPLAIHAGTLYVWRGNCSVHPAHYFVKTLLTRVIPLLVSIVVGFTVSAASIYAFLIAPRIFPSVPLVRACEAVGDFFLLPAKLVYQAVGGDQSTPLFDPISYLGTNGLILGILFYSIFRTIYSRWERRQQVNGVCHSRVPAEKVGSR